MTTNEIALREGRDLQLPTGEVVDVLADPDRVADYLDQLERQKREADAEIRRVEALLLPLMDEGTMAELQIAGGRIRKDPVGHAGREWNDQILAQLFEHAPADPDLAVAYKNRLIEALRPEYVYRPLVVKLRKLAEERPELAGIIADAEIAKPKPRHVHVERKGHS